VALAPSISLPDAEKLNVLRRLDQFRQWHSLDDERYCLVCGKIVTGQQIKVAGGTRGNGALRLNCPSERCNSISYSCPNTLQFDARGTTNSRDYVHPAKSFRSVLLDRPLNDSLPFGTRVAFTL
jgi:hypothetical protein